MSGVIERVLVALDAAAEAGGAIDAAVRLAARSKARLHAIFVEDEDLMHVARLPVARQLVPGAASGALSAAELELHWRAAAARADAELRGAARRQGLEISFEVVRGAVTTALAAASARDLVVAGALVRPVAGHFRVPSRWLAALELAAGPVLLAGEAGPDGGGVVALLDDRGAASSRLLKAAATLAELGGGTLTLFVPPPLAAAADLRRWAAHEIEAAGLRLRIEAAPADPQALRRRILELGGTLLALTAGTVEKTHLQEMTGGFACGLLIVR